MENRYDKYEIINEILLRIRKLVCAIYYNSQTGIVTCDC